MCVVDGVVEEMPGDADRDGESSQQSVAFHLATAIDGDAVTQVRTTLRRRILRAFVGRGLMQTFEAKKMLAYRHTGFSVDTSVRMEAHDRAALERLLRYCARSPFWTERLRKAGSMLVYRCAKQHSEPADPIPPKPSKAHYLWAVLIARIDEVFPLLCPLCGGQMRIIAFITHSADTKQIVDHRGVQAEPPNIAPARGPQLLDRGFAHFSGANLRLVFAIFLKSCQVHWYPLGLSLQTRATTAIFGV